MRCNTWLADATFSTCLKIFSQLWNIHGKIGDTVIPFAFFFLPNKEERTYVRALTILKERLDEVYEGMDKEPEKRREEEERSWQRLLLQVPKEVQNQLA